MPNIKNNVASQETRRKLIAAAGQVFAEKGLHAATLQEITNSAGANKASVNYHFRDKLELYAAVVRQAILSSTTHLLADSQDEQKTPEDQLASFVTRMMRDLLDPAQPPWRATIIVHELAQPTAALDAVMTELIGPINRRLDGIVRAVLGSGASEEMVARMSLSVAAQCILHLYNKEIIRRMYPALSNDAGQIDGIAEHITEFSLAALHAAKWRTNAHVNDFDLGRCVLRDVMRSEDGRTMAIPTLRGGGEPSGAGDEATGRSPLPVGGGSRPGLAPQHAADVGDGVGVLAAGGGGVQPEEDERPA